MLFISCRGGQIFQYRFKILLIFDKRNKILIDDSVGNTCCFWLCRIIILLVFVKSDKVCKKSLKFLEERGIKPKIRHCANTAAAILFKESRFDMVRIGIGLYGSALTWKSLIGEIKNVPAGSFVGYDLTEKTLKPSRLAVIPIGYWHGFDRGLSSMGEVLVKGKRCKIIGRVSMDMIIADVSGIKNAKPGNEVVIIGKSGKESINAEDVAQKIGTINYEVITRINPLIKRIYI